MKFIIVDQLSCLAHIKHTTQPTHFWLKLSIFVMYSQYIAMLLPMHGWNLWNYSDGHFKLFQMVAQSQLIIPIFADSQIDFRMTAFIITILLLSVIILIIFTLLLFGIYDNRNIIEHQSIRKSIFYFLQITGTVFQLPILFLLVSQILNGPGTLNFQNTILGMQSIINFFTLILFTIIIFFSQYFLRAYTFIPSNYIQSKFNGFQPLHYVLQVIMAVFYFVDNQDTVQYAQIAIIHLSLIFKIIESLIFKPYLPFMNEAHFKLSLVAEFINIIISFSVFTDGKIIAQEDILYLLLFTALFSYYLGEVFHQRKSIQAYDVDINCFSCISLAQELYLQCVAMNKLIYQQHFFSLYFYYKAHKVNCAKNWNKKHRKNDNHIQLTNQTIYCMLQTELEKAKSDTKTMYEELELFFINYVAEYINRPLLAYVELKKYETLTNQQSYFFMIVKYQMSQFLQQLVKKQQNLIKLNKKQLSIQSIHETLKFQESFIPKVKEIILEKISFWTNQIKGFNSIYDIERMALFQSAKIQILHEELQRFCRFDFHNLDKLSQIYNVQTIKFISMFFSAIMNDYYSTQICEQVIAEIFNIEHTQQDDLITNILLVEERAALVQISMVRNRGKIVNLDKRLLAKYFEFDEQEFQQIDNISALMPSFFAEKHDRLLQDYLQSAKSIFFDDYKLVFGISREGFLVPQQLKIDNDFSLLDDYILMGCMSKVKHSSDFVLFGEDGYLIGCTQNFYETFFQFQQSITKFTPDMIYQISICMLFPNIFDLLIDLRNKLKNDLQYGSPDNYCKIWKFYNQKDILDDGYRLQQSLKQFSTQNYEKSQSIQKSRTSQTSLDLNKTRLVQLQLMDNYEMQNSVKSIQYLHQLPLFNVVVQTQMVDNIRRFEEKQKQCFISKVQLQFRIMGKKDSRKAYFILEILDIRRTDDNKTNESLANNQYSNNAFSTNNNQQTNMENSQSFIQPSENGLEAPSVAVEEIRPDVSKINEVSLLIKKYGSRLPELSNYEGQLIAIESARDSMSYAPISQRIQFISPSSKQQQLQGLIEKDFTELQNQLEYGNGDPVNDIDVPESSQVKGISSNNKKENSHNLLQQLQENQLQQKKNDFEVSAKKSRSSNTSGTSGISAIQVIKKFQSKRDLTQSLQALLAINILIVLIITIYIIIHLTNVSSYHDELLQTLINIQAPLLFNRYFFKTFCYIWSLVFNSLNIINSSEYIIIQTLEEIQVLADTMLGSLRSMYDTFIGIEYQGMLSKINLDFLYQDNEVVTYTYFINFISNIADLLFQAQYHTFDDLGDLIDQNYLDNLLTLRYNLKNVNYMNVELLDSLNILFFDLQQSKLTEYQLQISIEIIVLCLVMFGQIYYWNQLEKYCQAIILLAGRLQENQAQEQIIRFSYVNETLQTFIGKQSWKQQNYYKLLYSSLNQLGLESVYTQSRILKEYQLQLTNKNPQKSDINNEEGQKKIRKNQNVVLNSRITNSGISIIKEVFIITISFLIILGFIIGGYFLYNSQASDLYPTQQLTLSFIRFTSQQDITISCALVIKSQQALYQKLIEDKYYTDAQISSFQGAAEIMTIFLEYYDSYFENLTNIYEFILESNRINGDDEAVLFNLYSEDFCTLLADLIPFCEQDASFFDTKYGTPKPEDNNREFISSGIQGVVSRIDTLFKQQFIYEIENKDYRDELDIVLEQLNTKEFNNAIFEHFLDTTDGTNLFIDNIMIILKNVMAEDLDVIYSYYLAAGISLIVIYCIIFGIWMYSTNQRLILLRLVLTNLPIETLTEPHTLTLLKKLK
ncbi:unnamed protein product [Paramecium octaurelia]|uniref:Transmembrane protein n=1 Tax=Paramecium octaurelia TaxID=43137 RepID=A0A8S1XZ41_PAROT|nr:unnamed protein product [Paramecium octaurelia]